jgi:hypothetical protein
MKSVRAVLALFLLLGAGPAARAAEGELWPAYLDYAYVYSSADSAALRQRLAEYGREAGMTLQEWLADQQTVRRSQAFDETAVRRRAIAQLLIYLSEGEPRALERAVDAVSELDGRLARHENRYWHHYILAHRALEKGRSDDFVGEILELWLKVVTPLETPYEALQTLSLSESPNSGFVSALPYLYENIARLVLIRSQEMGLDRGLGPLAAIVRLLHDGRVGAHPDVIPPEASSRDYVDRIVERLNGPESDAGNLTFTLALFEASKYHDHARALLATEGLGLETQKAIRVSAGAYETALDRADTLQGQCAVYTRVLRQLGEIYAAKQRLGVDPEIDTPFSIEGAIEVYSRLHKEGLLQKDGWEELGYASVGRDAYLDAMHHLWEEIQETSLNGADYYLSRSVADPARSDEHARNAARIYARYLAFFREFATEEGKEGLPDSAYFAAHEAAKGVGDAYLAYAQTPRPEEIELATAHYRLAMQIFPFERRLWSALTAALERQGRESEYMEIVRPAAEAVTHSRALNTWIENGEVGAQQLATLRTALSDSLVIMYMGFAEADAVGEIERRVDELEQRKAETEERLVQLKAQLSRGFAAAADDAPGPAAPAPDPAPVIDRASLKREVDDAQALLARLDKQIAASTRALPLYKATLATGGLTEELRARRDHPMHALLRRMYHEQRS